MNFSSLQYELDAQHRLDLMQFAENQRLANEAQSNQQRRSTLWSTFQEAWSNLTPTSRRETNTLPLQAETV